MTRDLAGAGCGALAGAVPVFSRCRRSLSHEPAVKSARAWAVGLVLMDGGLSRLPRSEVRPFVESPVLRFIADTPFHGTHIH